MAAARPEPEKVSIQIIPGERLHVLRLIGHGGFGEVYLAEDIHRHDKCAIKCLIGDSDKMPDR